MKQMLIFDADKPFYRGNLHTHTNNTDGQRAPEEVLDLYKANGYDFIALTDHWKRTVEGGAYLRDGMLVLPGIELDYTLPAQVVHIVGVGVDESILNEPRHNGIQSGIDAIRKAGGRAILGHPAWSLNTPEMIASMRNLTAAEIYNTVSGAPWNGDRADSTGILDVAAANGNLLNTVAADDAHFYNGDACASWIMLQADELTQESVLAALDKGAYYATRGPRFEQIEVTEEEVRVRCSEVQQVIFHTNRFYAHGRTVTGEKLTEAAFKRAPADRFMRIILIDENGKRAWCNPIVLA